MNVKKYPISMSSYSFSRYLREKTMDVFSFLDTLRYRYHLDYADIWTGFLPSFLNTDTFDEDLMRKIKHAMEARGITLANLCVDGPLIWNNDKDLREAQNKGAFLAVKAGIALGAKTIRIDMGVREDDINDEQFEHVVKVYGQLAAICKDNGMRIGTENHWGASRNPQVLQKVHAAINNDAYGILYHFRNFNDDDQEAGLETAVKMAMHTHIGAYTLPYAKETIRRMVNEGYQGAFSIEHHSGNLLYERIAWHVAALRGLIEELEEEGFDKPVTTDYFSRIYKGEDY